MPADPWDASGDGATGMLDEAHVLFEAMVAISVPELLAAAPRDVASHVSQDGSVRCRSQASGARGIARRIDLASSRTTVGQNGLTR
jgi:hypothetical protein